jgi:hypothetical protein
VIPALWCATWAAAAPPPVVPDPEAELHRYRSRGAVLTTIGAVSVGGGFALMSVGRGRSGEISSETQLESDLRSAGGGFLMIGGAAGLILGIRDLNEAHAIRREQKALTLTVGPDRLVLAGRF